MTNADLNRRDAERARRMLDSEQHSLVRLLHDDLGQNLVAIKSFAAALADQHTAGDDSTGDLASMIREAADLAYRSSYDLMQELRAQYLAERPISEALEACLEESRLQQHGIEYRYRVDAALTDLDLSTRAFVLRSVRCYANLCKALGACQRVSVDLHQQDDATGQRLVLALEHGGADSLDPAHLSMLALADRLEAAGGEMLFEPGARRLELHFDPLEHAGGSQ